MRSSRGRRTSTCTCYSFLPTTIAPFCHLVPNANLTHPRTPASSARATTPSTTSKRSNPASSKSAANSASSTPPRPTPAAYTSTSRADPPSSPNYTPVEATMGDNTTDKRSMEANTTAGNSMPEASTSRAPAGIPRNSSKEGITLEDSSRATEVDSRTRTSMRRSRRWSRSFCRVLYGSWRAVAWSCEELLFWELGSSKEHISIFFSWSDFGRANMDGQRWEVWEIGE